MNESMNTCKERLEGRPLDVTTSSPPTELINKFMLGLNPATGLLLQTHLSQLALSKAENSRRSNVWANDAESQLRPWCTIPRRAWLPNLNHPPHLRWVHQEHVERLQPFFHPHGDRSTIFHFISTIFPRSMANGVLGLHLSGL